MFLHIKLEIPSSPPYVHLQPLNRSDCIDMYERLKLLSNIANEKGYVTMCEESFDTLSLFREQYKRLYAQADELIHSKCFCISNLKSQAHRRMFIYNP